MPVTVDPVIPEGKLSNVAQPSIAIDDGHALRPFVDADGPLVAAAFDDPDIRYFHGFRIDTPEQAQEWIDRTHAEWAAERSGNWAIVGNDDVMVGRVGLYVNLRRGTSEIAYWILPDHRRQGVAVRATQALTTWAHDWLGVHRIVLQHSVRNEGSRAVARAAGYTSEGIARQEALHDDGWHDMHQHAHIVGDT